MAVPLCYISNLNKDLNDCFPLGEGGGPRVKYSNPPMGGSITLLVLLYCLDIREGRGAMARARSFANVAACCASSRLTRCRIFREISCFSQH